MPLQSRFWFPSVWNYKLTVSTNRIWTGAHTQKQADETVKAHSCGLIDRGARCNEFVHSPPGRQEKEARSASHCLPRKITFMQTGSSTFPNDWKQMWAGWERDWLQEKVKSVYGQAAFKRSSLPSLSRTPGYRLKAIYSIQHPHSYLRKEKRTQQLPQTRYKQLRPLT